VMLSGRHALVTDFGVAKAVSEATGRQTLTTAGVALGTPAYMAPEQAAADPHTDHRADIYAFGVVAYELLTGRPPFVASTPQAILGAHATMAPDPVTKYRPSISPGLAVLVMKCLEKLPADRWQSADELIPQLEAVLTPSGGMTPSATQPISTALVTDKRRRRRIGLAVGGAAVLALAVIGWRVFLRALAIDPDLVLVAPFENQTGDASLDRLGLEMAERLSLALTRAGVGKPVAATRVRELVGASGRGSAELAKRIARQVGAGVLVSGAYGGSQTTLEVRAELLRMPAGRQVSVVEPVTGASASMVADSLGEQLAAAVAANHDWGDDYGWGRDHRLPRSLAAYRALVEGDGNWTRGDGPKAAESYRKALALDPGWPSAVIGLAKSGLGGSQVRTTGSDSIAPALDPQSATLLPGDLDAAQYFTSWMRQDWEAAYRAAAARLRVDSVTWAGAGAWAAYYTDRLHEAVALGARRHLRSYWTDPARINSDLHGVMANALHGLGRHEEELALALEVRREFPEDQIWGITLEIEARAGLGQVADVERLVAEAEGLRPKGRWAFSESRSVIAVQELQTHGYTDAARRVAERGARWYERQLADRPGDINLLFGYTELLEWAGRWQDERVVAGRLLTAGAGKADSIRVLGWVGRAEAHLGHRDRALEVIRELDAAQGAPGEGAAHRGAVIHAILGDTLAAMDLFRESYDGGSIMARMYIARHREPPGLFLRDYPAFRELTRVRD